MPHKPEGVTISRLITMIHLHSKSHYHTIACSTTLILFPDIPWVSCSSYSHKYVIRYCELWFGMCMHVLTYDYFDKWQLAQTHGRWLRILNMWIFRNHCALSLFNGCRKSLCWKLLSLSKWYNPNKTLKIYQLCTQKADVKTL